MRFALVRRSFPDISANRDSLRGSNQLKRPTVPRGERRLPQEGGARVGAYAPFGLEICFILSGRS